MGWVLLWVRTRDGLGYSIRCGKDLGITNKNILEVLHWLNGNLNEAFQFYVSSVRVFCSLYEEIVVTLACCFVTIWATYAIIDLGPWHEVKPNVVILACYGKVIHCYGLATLAKNGMLIVAWGYNLVLHCSYVHYCHGDHVVCAYMIMNIFYIDGLRIGMSRNLDGLGNSIRCGEAFGA